MEITARHVINLNYLRDFNSNINELLAINVHLLIRVIDFTKLI